MKFVVFVLCFFSALGLYSQQILVLEKAGTFDNYKYHTGEYISLSRLHDPTTISGEISKITDTSIIINYLHQIKLKEVEMVYRDRWLWGFLNRLGKIMSASYFVVAVSNNLIQHTWPMISKDVLWVSGTSLGTALISGRLERKTCNLQKGWRLRVLNFSAIEIKK